MTTNTIPSARKNIMEFLPSSIRFRKRGNGNLLREQRRHIWKFLNEKQNEIQAFIDRKVKVEYEDESPQDSAEAYRWVWEEELSQLLQPIMVMKDMDTLRPTHVLERGVYDAKGKQVETTTPNADFAIPPMTHLRTDWVWQMVV